MKETFLLYICNHKQVLLQEQFMKGFKAPFELPFGFFGVFFEGEVSKGISKEKTCWRDKQLCVQEQCRKQIDGVAWGRS